MPQDVLSLQWPDVLALLTQAAADKKLDAVLDVLLSPDERHDVLERMRLFSEFLLNDKSQRQMSKDLSISIATITRASHNLKAMPADLKQYLSSVVDQAASRK